MYVVYLLIMATIKISKSLHVATTCVGSRQETQYLVHVCTMVLTNPGYSVFGTVSCPCCKTNALSCICRNAKVFRPIMFHHSRTKNKTFCWVTNKRWQV
ncbi:hypothetical protein PF005_g3604 [Phytophthora fragariae]|uniref:Secreted protein n=1 Tax=Phytophthora fragariae TaxID=53985 RepID=A0A6A3FF72_9STRA|nr:hypothetical protein PF003_g21510 [Phytophthora fragariae]KAE8944465.1 hypothetical protein PF009_g5835 [Phytophthora fragariae]KAE9001179.1 hypothetical protein PF011_g13854 [Phytophthora fragariae]KAE9132695.1 hypothetical protein PF007_g3615 [Phytophthora fragariae]KAE9152727.1 hypothetical protein PF006_g3063 [Phytophthora fragariae]